MIIAKRELRLVAEVEVSGKIAHRCKNLLGLLLPNDFGPDIQFPEMVLVGTEKSPENGSWSGGCARIEAVADGGVETGKGILLCFFKNSEEPSKSVTDIGISFV